MAHVRTPINVCIYYATHSMGGFQTTLGTLPSEPLLRTIQPLVTDPVSGSVLICRTGQIEKNENWMCIAKATDINEAGSAIVHPFTSRTTVGQFATCSDPRKCIERGRYRLLIKWEVQGDI